MNNRNEHTTLDSLFLRAKEQAPLIPDEALNSLLSNTTASGRHSTWDRISNDLSRTKNTGRTMKIIALTIVAATIGTALLYNGIQQNRAATGIQGTTSTVTTGGNNGLSTTAPTLATIPEGTHQGVLQDGVAKELEESSFPDITDVTLAALPQATLSAPANSPLISKAFPRVLTVDERKNALMEKFRKKIATTIQEYWITRVNGYKVYIDNNLGSGDLQTLNKLRVQWGLIDDEGSKPGMSFDINTQIGENGEKNSLSISLGMSAGKGDQQQNTNAKQSPDTEQKDGMSVKSQMGDDIQEKAWDDMNEEERTTQMNAMFDMVEQMMAMDTSAPARIITEVRTVARNHRTALDKLKQTILNDVSSFMETVPNFVHTFIDDNRNEIEEVGLERLLEKEGEVDNMMNEVREKGFPMLSMMYRMFEPTILLYNGSDINTFLSTISQPVTGVALEANTTLQQSYPNPATSSVTVPYQLTEPSAATVLRIYNTEGVVVATRDEGSRSAGSHTAEVPVADLPNGVYLYHLTIQTSKGEQVYSRTMQVVH